MEPLDNKNAVGFKVARTLVSVHGRKFCPVWNDSDQPITLKHGTPIATVSPIADIIRTCTDEESIGDVRRQTSTMDTKVNIKYIHNLNILNKNINAYNTTQQQDARIPNHDTYKHTRHHSNTQNTHYTPNYAHHPYENDVQCSHDNNAQQDTHVTTPLVTHDATIHKTIHHTYEELDLKIDNPELTTKIGKNSKT